MKPLLLVLLLAILGIMVVLPHTAAASTLGDLGQTHGDRHQTDLATGHESEHQFGHRTLAMFHARLTGDAQLPPVNTDAFGFAEVRLFQNGTSSAIEFRVVVCNIANVTRSHIHVGSATSNGAIVVHFVDLTTPVSSIHGCTILSRGIRGPNDLHTDPSSGVNTWTDFVQSLLSGNTYVNVHTTANPGGEIRGQLISTGQQDNDQGKD